MPERFVTQVFTLVTRKVLSCSCLGSGVVGLHTKYPTHAGGLFFLQCPVDPDGWLFFLHFSQILQAQAKESSSGPDRWPVFCFRMPCPGLTFPRQKHFPNILPRPKTFELDLEERERIGEGKNYGQELAGTFW